MYKFLPLLFLAVILPSASYALSPSCNYFASAIGVLSFYILTCMVFILPFVVGLDWRSGIYPVLAIFVSAAADVALSFSTHPGMSFLTERTDESGCSQGSYFAVAGLEVEFAFFLLFLLYLCLFFFAYKIGKRMKANPTWRLKLVLLLFSASAILPFILMLEGVRLWFL